MQNHCNKYNLCGDFKRSVHCSGILWWACVFNLRASCAVCLVDVSFLSPQTRCLGKSFFVKQGFHQSQSLLPGCTVGCMHAECSSSKPTIENPVQYFMVPVVKQAWTMYTCELYHLLHCYMSWHFMHVHAPLHKPILKCDVHLNI